MLPEPGLAGLVELCLAASSGMCGKRSEEGKKRPTSPPFDMTIISTQYLTEAL